MGKVKVPEVSNVNSWEELKRFVSISLSAIISEINGRLSFGENISTSGPLSVVFPNSTGVVTVFHSLGRIPTGFIVVNLTAAMSIFQPANFTWAKDRIFLKSSAAGTAQIYVF